MADWDALRDYIKANYKIAEDHQQSVKLVFDVDGSRTQAVIVSQLGDTGWAEVSTAVGTEQEIDPRTALLLNAGLRVGGLALLDTGLVIFRHTFPLATLDVAEFEEPLEVAVKLGDELERELSGGRDIY